MDKLNIPGKNRSFAYIIPAIRNIKTQSSSEQQENEHYTNAQNLVESVSSSVKNEKTWIYLIQKGHCKNLLGIKFIWLSTASDQNFFCMRQGYKSSHIFGWVEL